MILQLTILRGVLRRQNGDDFGDAIAIRGPRFTIGTAGNCQLKCRSSRINPLHCVIEIERDRIVVRDTGSLAGTYVNDRRIDGSSCLFDKDRLRVGGLEFEVNIRSSARLIPSPRYRLVLPVSDRQSPITAPSMVARRLVGAG